MIELLSSLPDTFPTLFLLYQGIWKSLKVCKIYLAKFEEEPEHPLDTGDELFSV